MDYRKRDEELKEASGEVSYSDPLTTFLYLLLHKELFAGKVEELVQEAVKNTEGCLFSNGWLAHYANNLASELQNAERNHLKKALENAFADVWKDKTENIKIEQEEKTDNVIKATENSVNLGGGGGGALLELEEKLIKIAGVSNVSETGDVKPETTEEAVDVAKDAVQQLVDQGQMSQEDANNLKSDIGNVAEEEEPVGEAVEIVKDHSDEQKWSSEKAKEVVDTALEAYDSAEKLDVDKATKMVDDGVESTTIVDVTDDTKEEDQKQEQELSDEDIPF